MKVTHVIHFLDVPGQLVFSGAENHLMVLLEGLARIGLDVELLALVNKMGDTLQNKFDALRHLGVKVTVLNKPKKRNIRFLFLYRLEWNWELKKMLDQRKDRIFHFHLDPVCMTAAGILSRAKATYLTIHSDSPTYNRPDYRLWLHMIHCWMTGFIAISEHVRTHLAKAAMISENSIPVIPYGYPEPLNRKTRDQLRADFGIPPDSVVVGFVGRLTAQKNLPVLIRALSKRPQLLGVLVGSGEDRAKLEQSVKSLSIKNIRFLGSQPNGCELIQMFDIFCLPSLWEGLGLVLLEAMFQQVPIVASRRGAIPGILGNGAYGTLFDPRSADELLQAIEGVLGEPEKSLQMVSKASEYVRLRFRVETMIDQTLDVYRRS